MADIKRAYTLFHDEARTVQFLNEYSREFLYNEDGDSEDEYDEVRFWNIISYRGRYFAKNKPKIAPGSINSALAKVPEYPKLSCSTP